MAKTETKEAKTGSRKVVRYSEKATMNFARRESSFNIKKMLPILAAIVIAALLFVKLGFMDQIEKKVEAYARLSEKQAQLAAVNARLSDYDALAEKYGRYSYGWMSDSEKNTVDRMEVLKLIDSKIMTKAAVNDFSVNNNVLTMNVSGITLKEASSIVMELEQDPLVDGASVYSASAENAEEAEIFMSVTLTNEKEAEG